MSEHFINKTHNELRL